MLIIDLLITLYCYWIYSYFLFENDQTKAIKEEIQNNSKIWTNSL